LDVFGTSKETKKLYVLVMKWRWALALVWAGVIFGSSCTVIFRTSFLDKVHGTAPALASRAQLDNFWDRYWWIFVKGYHALEYFVLFLAILWAWQPKHRGRALAATWLICVAYAGSDEYHQTFVPDRGGRWTDVVIDAGGAAGALVFSRKRAS